MGTRQAQAAGTLGQSNQNLVLTGLGPNSSGDGVSRVTWGSCSYDGTNTTCTLSGSFTGLGSGGTYNFVLKYAGNGPSPLTAITQPGSDLFTLALSSGSLTFTFNESNGTTLTYNKLSYSIFYIPGLTTCTPTLTDCGPGGVGQTAGATISGPVNGSFNIAPTIQTVISASDYGGFTSIAPATWIEIYGQNLASTTREWGGTDFQGSNAPINLSDTTVTVGGQSAFVFYISPSQVNVQVPSNVATGSQPVIVTTDAGASAPFNINVNATEPGLLAPAAFKINGQQYVVAQFVDGFFDLPPGTPNVASRLAVPGDIVTLYGIGFGPLSDGTPAGVIDANQNHLSGSLNVTVGGVTAQLQYQGLTPQLVGLYAFNVVIPNIPANNSTPLTFSLNGTPGTQTLYLFVGN
jgi:uncharacterized protein (TIGR03437 family)